MDRKKMKKIAFPFTLIILGFAIITSSIGIFFEISEGVVNQEIRVFDDTVIGIVKNLSSSWVYDMMIVITELGSVWFIALVSISTALYLWFREKDKWAIIFLIISIGGGGLIIQVLKNYFQTDRPAINEHIDAIGYSFPSGHAMGSLIIYGFITYLVIRSKLSKDKKIAISTVLIFLIILISLSRIYLSAHFPSDVFAGQFGGLAWLLICIISLEAVEWKNRNELRS